MTKKKKLVTFIICLLIMLVCATPAYILIICNLKDNSILLPFSCIFWGVMILIIGIEAFAIFTDSGPKEKSDIKLIDNTTSYLKWKDLTFPIRTSRIKATLNNAKVTLECWKEGSKEWCHVEFGNAACNNMLFVHHGYDDDTDTQSDLFDALGFKKKEN